MVLSVHPGETQLLVKGRWTGLTKSIAVGPVSKEWLEKQNGKNHETNKSQLASFIFSLPQHLQDEIEAEVGCVDTSVAELCETNNIRFMDPRFPPAELSFQQPWQRGDLPKRYSFKPPAPGSFLVSDISPLNVNQGALADCALMAAITSIAKHTPLIDFMFTPRQSPDLGIHRLRFCLDGAWSDIVVDDFLPFSGCNLAFAQNRVTPTELWIPLLEKAYAKAVGSYAGLKSAQCGYAFTDLTGCPTKITAITGSQEEFETIRTELHEGATMVLGTPGKNLMSSYSAAKPADQETWDRYRSMDLICEHSYSVLGLHDEGETLLKLRNPWGTTQHGLWKGTWGTDDPLAQHLYNKKEDGVFYMSWADVKKWFNTCTTGFPLLSYECCFLKSTWEPAPKVAVQLFINPSDFYIGKKVWIGVQQNDTRGKEGMELKAMALYVVAKAQKDKVKVIESIGTLKRDRYTLLTITNDLLGKKILVVPQLKDSNMTGGYSMSLHIEDLSSVGAMFVRPKDEGTWRASAKEVKFSDWKPAGTLHQMKGPKLTGGEIKSSASERLLYSYQGDDSEDLADCSKTSLPKYMPPVDLPPVDSGIDLNSTTYMDDEIRAQPISPVVPNPQVQLMPKAEEEVVEGNLGNFEIALPEEVHVSPTVAVPIPLPHDDDDEVIAFEVIPPEPLTKHEPLTEPDPITEVDTSKYYEAPPPDITLEAPRSHRKSFMEVQQDRAASMGKACLSEARVEIGLLSAEGLADKGSQNPFCEVKLREVTQNGGVGSGHSNPQKKTTKVAAKTLSPVWNEVFRFIVPVQDCVRVSIFSKKSFSKAFLGHVDIHCSTIMTLTEANSKGSAFTTSFKVQPDPSKKDRASVTGTLFVSLRVMSTR
eukprot:TRINITY_DN16409_c2_g1_i1.p1 TRINITY_DN16409_c2_g1~~TRINITY_DN16409_c2_g1_i1.p1  ORF type:complete len:939 (+),score=223.98 TRINITY_DN16409_c2_g1_i1:198-2819(+)